MSQGSSTADGDHGEVEITETITESRERVITTSRKETKHHQSAIPSGIANESDKTLIKEEDGDRSFDSGVSNLNSPIPTEQAENEAPLKVLSLEETHGFLMTDRQGISESFQMPKETNKGPFRAIIRGDHVLYFNQEGLKICEINRDEKSVKVLKTLSSGGFITLGEKIYTWKANQVFEFPLTTLEPEELFSKKKDILGVFPFNRKDKTDIIFAIHVEGKLYFHIKKESISYDWDIISVEILAVSEEYILLKKKAATLLQLHEYEVKYKKVVPRESENFPEEDVPEMISKAERERKDNLAKFLSEFLERTKMWKMISEK